jgi:excisionase family DNA binding protein
MAKTNKMDNKELMDNHEFLTTGQAASLCSVTRNTIFKWIQSGYLTARRTAGGHHRINKRDLDQLINTPAQISPDTNGAATQTRYQYCWEYNGNGKAQDACLNCAVYTLRALRCYEVAKLAPEVNHARIFCDQDCGDCNYYREMHGKTANVLVVTNDPEITKDLLANADTARFNVEITDCEYNCSAMVDHFKPDFVIIDCSLGSQVSRQMSNHIMKDPRIPYVRVILSGDKGDFPHECDREIFAHMASPLSISNITECISMAGNEIKV